MAEQPDFGALVISLDFELHWGVRDHEAVDGPYRPNLVGVWDALPRMLDLFERFEVAATWATVGLLFARTRDEQQRYHPSLRPTYDDDRLDPYHEPVGADEVDDPLHFAPSLIADIRGRRGQEIGTHTYSHYYCLEPGQTEAQFAADLAAAVAISTANGIRPRSLALPRNQFDPAYAAVIRAAGIDCIRSNQPSWMYRAAPRAATTRLQRGARLAHEHVGPEPIHLSRWGDLVRPDGLVDVPASLFLRGSSPARPGFDALRRRRIIGAMRSAAASRRIIHLWWHPHNFGRHTDASLAFLTDLLEAFDQLRETHRFRSLSMGGAADTVVGDAS